MSPDRQVCIRLRGRPIMAIYFKVEDQTKVERHYWNSSKRRRNLPKVDKTDE